MVLVLGPPWESPGRSEQPGCSDSGGAAEREAEAAARSSVGAKTVSEPVAMRGLGRRRLEAGGPAAELAPESKAPP